MIRSLCLILTLSFAVSTVSAQSVPFADDAPKAEKVLDARMFEFVAATLHSNRLGKHMRCELKVTQGKEVRTFSTGTKWVEFLDVDYKSNAGAGGGTMHVKFPLGLKYGLKNSVNKWSAVGEDILLQSEDRDGHWLRFVHDGKGEIVFFMMGNDLRTLPCISKE